MSTLNIRESASTWKQVEAELLTHVRAAEIEFKLATEDQKERAGERFREALAQFSELILDRRFPPGFQLPG